MVRMPVVLGARLCFVGAVQVKRTSVSEFLSFFSFRMLPFSSFQIK